MNREALIAQWETLYYSNARRYRLTKAQAREYVAREVARRLRELGQ